MADYGIFRSGDAKRIAAATRRVEGTPRQYIRVPEQISRRYGGVSGGGADTVSAIGAAFSIAELDPTTGDIITTLYRGTGRNSSTSPGMGDILMLYSSDGFLYAGGQANPNRDTANVIKWNPDARTREWEADRNGLTTPTIVGVTSGLPSDTFGPSLIEASDGAIWARDGAAIARFAAATGVQSHAYATTTTSCDVILSTGESGAIIVVNDNGNTPGTALRRLSSSAVSTHTVATTALSTDGAESVSVSNGYVVWLYRNDTSVRVNLVTDLSSVTTHTPGGSLYGVATDGTQVFIGAANYESRSITNLATTLWTGGALTSTGAAHLHLMYDRGKLYHFGTAPRVARIDPSDGSIEYNVTPAISLGIGRTAAAGSDFMVYGSGGIGSGQNILCLNDSDGSTRWGDFWNSCYSILVTSDDRVFICGTRREI